jgi:anti-sigma B factor antagonist
MLDIRVREDGTVMLTGRLDASQADQAMERFRKFDGPLTADFAGLDYISSAGISVMVETHKRLRDAGQIFKLVNMQPRVRNVFMYSGLDRVLRIE